MQQVYATNSMYIKDDKRWSIKQRALTQEDPAAYLSNLALENKEGNLGELPHAQWGAIPSKQTLQAIIITMIAHSTNG